MLGTDTNTSWPAECLCAAERLLNGAVLCHTAAAVLLEEYDRYVHTLTDFVHMSCVCTCVYLYINIFLYNRKKLPCGLNRYRPRSTLGVVWLVLFVNTHTHKTHCGAQDEWVFVVHCVFTDFNVTAVRRRPAVHRVIPSTPRQGRKIENEVLFLMVRTNVYVHLKGTLWRHFFGGEMVGLHFETNSCGQKVNISENMWTLYYTIGQWLPTGDQIRPTRPSYLVHIWIPKHQIVMLRKKNI